MAMAAGAPVTKDICVWFDDLCRRLAARGDTDSITREFSALNTNSERVLYAYGLLESRSEFPVLTNEVQKCEQKSARFRQEGNKLYVVGRDSEAIECYTKSALYADKTETLALAYANRSAVLLRLGLYGDCLRDISNALASQYPTHLSGKIVRRREKAEQLFRSGIEEKYYSDLPVLSYDQNPRIECASDCVDIAYAENQGRHVVATRNINPGCVIAAEAPYISVLLEDSFTAHCYNCFRWSRSLLPCSFCPSVGYCSGECRDTAYDTYHRYECPILSSLLHLKVDKFVLLALRIAIVARNESAACDSTDGAYRAARYREIHNLVTNAEHRSVSYLFRRATTAAVVMYLLERKTTFFNDSENLREFTAELLLRHIQTATSNMHEISEIGPTGCESSEIGAGAYSFLSMLNHSCSPNVVRHCYGNRIVLRALRPIRKGEQLFDNYGYHHALMPKKERQRHLRDQYCFECQCEACINVWPLYKDMDSIDGGRIIEASEMESLTSCSRSTADCLAVRFENLVLALDKTIPSRKLADCQEILKQCYAILANKIPTLK